VTGLLIRARRAWWHASYHGHLALLTALAVVRYLAVGVALLAHRAHGEVAAHGQVVADTTGNHHYHATRPRPERYTRMAYFLLDPKDRVR
jgi:hypothetical protein